MKNRQFWIVHWHNYLTGDNLSVLAFTSDVVAAILAKQQAESLTLVSFRKLSDVARRAPRNIKLKYLLTH